MPNSENSPDSLGFIPDTLGWPEYSAFLLDDLEFTQYSIKTRKFRFLEPGSSGFQQLYHYLARDLLFHPLFTLSHTVRHFYYSGEAILWRFKNLTKDFKGQRWALGDFNPEVLDLPSGIDFKPFPP